MQVSVTGRHYEVTPALKAYIDARLERFARWATPVSTQVMLSAEKHRHRAEIILRIEGKEFASKNQSEDMYSAVDCSADKIERQLRRFKDRKKTARKNGQGARMNGELISGTLRVLKAGSVGKGPELHEIVRASEYQLEPLTIDEAIVKLEKRQENFLVFSNRGTDLIHIVYRDAEGDYGVLNLHTKA
jgi:putative sigma-54 modulation protein